MVERFIEELRLINEGHAKSIECISELRNLDVVRSASEDIFQDKVRKAELHAGDMAFYRTRNAVLNFFSSNPLTPQGREGELIRELRECYNEYKSMCDNAHVINANRPTGHEVNKYYSEIHHMLEDSLREIISGIEKKMFAISSDYFRDDQESERQS